MAKKAPFSTLFGLLTKKTFAGVYKQIRGEAYAGRGTPGFLLRHHGCDVTLERCTASLFSMTDFRVSRKRVECFYFL
jgi:hypothetical protein